MSHSICEGFGSRVIHGGNTKDRGYRSLSMPVYQTSTFYFDSCEDGGKAFAGESDSYIYTRLGNPTIALAEEKIAEMECAEAAVATGSGMGAISSVLWTIAGAGKHIVADGTLYGCTYSLLSHGMTRYGVEVTFVDSSDPGEVRSALRENTVAVYLETPANPTLKIADIRAIAELVHAYNKEIKVVVDNTFEEKTKEIPGGRVLKSAIIYGANGAGKSNLVNAIAFVKDLVTNSIGHQPGQGIRQTPHKLDGFEKDSAYRIQFIAQDVRYVFGFSLRNMLVSDEYLYYFPNNRQTKIYERSGETFSAGNKFQGKFTTCKDVLKPNRLLLSCAANFSSVKEVEDAYTFFNNELVIYSPANQDNWMHYSLRQMNENPKMKSAVLNFLSELDTGIEDIQVKIDEKKLDPSELPPFLSDEFRAMILQNNINAITARVVYDRFDIDLMQEESTGIQKLFGILCPIIDIMTNGKVLICDELESSLHESLVFGLVKLFMNTQTDKFAQMIFTTHETGLLNLDLFRRDQIWFAEMRKDDRSTDLYSLAEIKNVRKEDNFGRGYISGKYGAIPMLNLNFADIVSEM